MPLATAAMHYGAAIIGNEVEFHVWAPNARHVALRLLRHGQTEPIELAMTPTAGGDFILTAEAAAGDRYFYLPDDHPPTPDPVSRLLPEGVHGPTEIVDPAAFRWTDQAWRGLALEDYILYELHLGTFSREGTCEGVIERLEYLRTLGVTAIELMPVAAFPGTHNWGYDGVSPYAVQASYGGPDALKRLVDAAHACSLAVVLDVVYNHLGNEGNYLRRFGPYFTARHQTPWGEAINYDQEGCEGVRRYVEENALYWISEYHLDGLRLDAVQTMQDGSPRHILAEIQDSVQSLAREVGRKVRIIAESDENDARLVRAQSQAGYGLDAFWSDDFHHAVHAYFTGERNGYYQDFGEPQQLVRALNEGFAFQGEFFRFWQRPRGAPAAGIALPQHVICTQNHDQVGNRALGERLSQLVPCGVRKLTAALLLLSPHTPLLFMGQEYDEPAPFQFFTSYSDPELQKAVGEGRRREFKHFDGKDVPDPEDVQTFERSRLNWDFALHGNPMLAWYRELIALRKRLVTPGPRTCSAELRDGVIVMRIPRENPRLLVAAALAPGAEVKAEAGWRELLSSDDDGYAVRVYEPA